MAETANLALPLLQPAQAQKHVTVNEALARLDGIAQLVLQSATVAAPPAGAVEGTAWAVPAGASGDWAGRDGRVALRLNGGWEFVTPRTGWRAFVDDTGAMATHDGADWVPAAALGLHGAATLMRVATVEHVVSPGAVSHTVAAIPARAVVFAVTGRVTQAITGSLASWQLGVDGSDNRHGSGLGLGAGSWVVGVTGSPVTYWTDTALKLTATGGSFAAGTVRLAVHMMTFAPPRG
jgi:hypothetical protein